MTPYDLYSPNNGLIITITEEQLTEICNSVSMVVASAYYDHMVIWETPLWKEMQMIAITAKPKQCVIDKYKENIDIHMELISRIYIDEDENEDYCMMNRKRPFGNSNVIGDVAHAILQTCKTQYEPNYLDRISNEILEEFSRFIQDFFKNGFTLTTNSFKSVDYPDKKIKDEWSRLGVNSKHPYLLSWRTDISTIREMRLKEIGI